LTAHAAEAVVYRSHDAVLGGVCAGLADRFDLDPIVVRILAVFIALLTAGLGIIVYLVLWARLPLDVDLDVPYEVTPESAESKTFGSVDCSTGRAASRSRLGKTNSIALPARMAIAIGLMLLFIVVAVTLAPMVPGTEWWQFWPLALVIAGLCLIIIPVPTSYENAWHALGIIVTSAAVLLLPISLEILSWETVPTALSRAWPVVVAAGLMFAYGLYRKSDAHIIGASFFFVAFFIYALLMCGVPCSAQDLILHMPDSRFIQIVFLGA